MKGHTKFQLRKSILIVTLVTANIVIYGNIILHFTNRFDLFDQRFLQHFPKLSLRLIPNNWKDYIPNLSFNITPTPVEIKWDIVYGHNDWIDYTNNPNFSFKYPPYMRVIEDTPEKNYTKLQIDGYKTINNEQFNDKFVLEVFVDHKPEDKSLVDYLTEKGRQNKYGVKVDQVVPSPNRPLVYQIEYLDQTSVHKVIMLAKYVRINTSEYIVFQGTFTETIEGLYNTLLGNIANTLDSHPVLPTQTEPAAYKVYTNDYYHFSIDIPENWLVEESILENSVINYRLSSFDNSIIIQNTSADGAKGIGNNGVQVRDKYPVGNYSATRISQWIDEKFLDSFFVVDPPQKTVPLQFLVQDDSLEKNQTLTKILDSFKFTQIEPKLTDQISYILPNDWEAEYSSEYDLISISTKNSNAQEIPNISISKSLRPEHWTLENSRAAIENPNLGITQYLGEKTIDENQALLSWRSYEGSGFSYVLIIDNSIWTIVLHCGTCKATDYTQNTYSQFFNDFIDSIKFTQ